GGLLLLPVAPLRGVVWIGNVLAEEAERELESRESPAQALADLQARRANGEISDEEADALEAELIERSLARRGLQGGA
ncbi:MAG: Gas vesicle protein, partial [Baekduia sp.]|nr:Gas vesicle protein [Baekduia sp.]